MNPRVISRLFTPVPREYPGFLALLSWGQAGYWRRSLRQSVGARRGRFLDVACGPGTLVREWAQRRTGFWIVGVDVTLPMLATAQRSCRHEARVAWVCAAAEALPLRQAVFAVVTQTLAFRNLGAPEAALGEVRRVLTGNGVFALLDFVRPPAGWWGRMYRSYVARVLPVWGRLRSRPWARLLRYLAGSIAQSRSVEELAALVAGQGLVVEAVRRLTAGVVGLVVARKAVVSVKA